VLALSTSCAPGDWPLEKVLASFRRFEGLRRVALHRPPDAAEARGMTRFIRAFEIVALFTDAPEGSLGVPLLVVEGGPAAEGDREQSLEGLCRRLHAFKGHRVALRPPAAPGGHPAPDEIALVHEALGFVGYWHEPARAGEEYLEAAARMVLGASFHPLREKDPAGLRQALPFSAPAVVACPPDTPRAEVAEALRCARGLFGT